MDRLSDHDDYYRTHTASFPVAGLRLAYWQWGDPHAAPLVLLHGKRDHARSFERIAEAYCDQYSVIAPDLHGHGDSDWAIGGYYGISEYVADLCALIDLLGGRADVLGHSLGSRVALYTAGAFPTRVSSVIAIEATINVIFRGFSNRPLSEPEALRRWISRQTDYADMEPRVYPTLQAACKRLQLIDSRMSDPVALEIARYATRAVEGGYIWKFGPFVRGRSSGEIDAASVSRFWSAVECPVLHLLGGASKWSSHPPSAQDRTAFRHARWVLVPDAGHCLHHDQPEITLRESRQFLAEYGAA